MPLGREGQETRTPSANGGSLDRHTRHLAALASKADGPQVRRQPTPWSRTASCDGADSRTGRSLGARKQHLGLFADTRDAGQPRSPGGTQYDCQNAQRKRPRARAVRRRKTSWQQFLQAHWEVLAAADFFTIEVWTQSGLVRVVVLFVIELSTRRVEIAGFTTEPKGAWMTQVARNLTDVEDGFVVGKRFLIHDRDPLFTKEFRETLAAAGVESLRLPARSPQPQRLRRALCQDDQGILLGADDPVWGVVATTSESGVHRPLPSRTQSPRARQSAHLP